MALRIEYKAPKTVMRHAQDYRRFRSDKSLVYIANVYACDLNDELLNLKLLHQNIPDMVMAD